MKIISIENIGRAECYVTLRSDSSVLRNNDNFYRPDFSNDVVCTVGLLIRITRLAKCVDVRFASRCYDAVGVGIAFTARDIMQQAIAAGHPCDEAYCFDKSIALSPEFLAAGEVGAGEVAMQLGERHLSGSMAATGCTADDAVAHASELLTLKTGDLVFVSLTEPIAVAEGEDVTASLNGVELLNFQIR